MPEGPSIVILKEEAQQFAGRKVISINGNSKIDQQRLAGLTVNSFKSWGKHFLICFDDFFVRIHFLMFGSYRINEKRDRPERLSLAFDNGELNFYSCSVRIVEGDADSVYDFSSDVLSDTWNREKAMEKLTLNADELVCDVLLDQDLFSGVGNIIKNEVLYRIRVHPESRTGSLPDEK
ncbi:MAG TPA: DNA-formamidopyrimidine glycosylase family protein, partial [Bacteroidales bacterium]|nr:DNA-formamidopyrimidine glycosylase family protein [Bacteroidales bacterium]